MTKLYRTDVRVIATAYIRAENKTAARRRALSLQGKVLEVKQVGGDVAISGLTFNDPKLPTISLSPAMTLDYPVDTFGIEEVES